MEFGWLELLLICLSTSTFITAMFLLFWVSIKGGYHMCFDDDDDDIEAIHEKSDLQAYYYRMSSPTEILTYTAIPKPTVEVHVTSPEGTTMSDKTREHILTSHPHFWENVSPTGKQTSYGSIAHKPSSIGSDDRSQHSSMEDLLAEEYTYTTLNFHLMKYKNDDKPDLYQLVSVKTQKLNFKLRDLYLELHYEMLKTDLKESEKLSKEEFSEKGIKRLWGGSKHGSKQPLKPFQIDVPLSKMMHPYIMTQKLLFPWDSKTGKPILNATCYLLRNGTKVYVACGDVVDDHESLIRDDVSKNQTDEQDMVSENNIVEMKMEFLHEPKISVGKANLSLTYLPTAEKICISIKEFMLTAEKEAEIPKYEDLYWKVTYHRSNKRRSKRKLMITPVDQKHHIWSCDTVLTLDRVTSQNLSSSFFICTLLAKVEEKVTTDSSTQSSIPGSKKDDKNDIIIGEMYIGRNVPDTSCREHWLEVLRVPRLTVEKWHVVV